MGVPAFFRWLSRKYPSIVVHCVEEKRKVIDGQTISNDCSKPNPNNVEFDNLYLDMNGIIHPCCHPENKAAPKNEDEMMVAIFEYIDRLFNIIRPRKLLYMAIDGVAPRAKMNQQRSRRFRASKETAEKVDEIRLARERLLNEGCVLPPEKPKEEHFDSNCITPGTPFMDRLAKCLHYYIHERLNTDPGWKNIQVILSDANVPGEGEHKIMDYIRRQRACPSHDPNIHHCLCGADADLIMLGLATHEPQFTIIREEFKPNQPRPCELCGQIGHEMKECRGLGKIKEGEFDELEKPVGSETDFIFIRLNVLREYLEKELAMHSVPFPYDFERCIDDWVFMCFFVGNDFLPHLPSLEIREGAIDRLVRLYKSAVNKIGGYLTESGLVNASRVQLIMTELGEAEDEIFKRRQENELMFRAREKAKKKRMKMGSADRPAWIPAGQYAPKPIMSNPSPIHNARQEGRDMRKQGMQQNIPQNKNAAEALKAMLRQEGEDTGNAKGEKRKKDNSDEEEEPHDEVRLWEDGWKERYYASKFEVSEDNIAFRHKVAAAYTLGLCWVLRYYYQGCASWKWFFPYHYAPFASDFVNVGDVCTDFEKGTKPFNPMEQLMGVFPAASKKHVPKAMAELMIDPESTIIDFYPDDFKVDLNGKKWAWQGVALLPFVDERRLLDALTDAYKTLTKEEKKRNIRGDDVMFVRKGNAGYNFLLGIYDSKNYEQEFDLNPEYFGGISSTVLLSEDSIGPNETLYSPVFSLDPIPNNAVVCVRFRDPKFDEDYVFPAKRLPGAKEPNKVLKPGEISRQDNQRWRPQVGMAPARQRAHLDNSGFRKLDRSLNPYSSVAPPSGTYSQGSRYSSPRTSFGSGGGGKWQQYQHQGESSYRGPSGSYGGGAGHQRSYSAPDRSAGGGAWASGGSGGYQFQSSYQAGGGSYQSQSGSSGGYGSYQSQGGDGGRSYSSQSSGSYGSRGSGNGGYQSQDQRSGSSWRDQGSAGGFGQQSQQQQGYRQSSGYQGSGYQSSRYQGQGDSQQGQQQQGQQGYWR